MSFFKSLHIPHRKIDLKKKLQNVTKEHKDSNNNIKQLQHPNNSPHRKTAF